MLIGRFTVTVTTMTTPSSAAAAVVYQKVMPRERLAAALNPVVSSAGASSAGESVEPHQL